MSFAGILYLVFLTTVVVLVLRSAVTATARQVSREEILKALRERGL